MPEIQKLKIEINTPESSDALALGLFGSSDKDKPGVEFKGKRSNEIAELVKKINSSGHFFGKRAEAEVLRFYSINGSANSVLVGLGPEKKFSAESLRMAGAALSQTQRRARFKTVTVDAPSFFDKAKTDLPYYLQAFCEGYLLAGYEFIDLKKQEKERFAPVGAFLSGLGKDKRLTAAIHRATVLASAVNFSRSLGDRPGNFMTPSGLAEQAQQMAKRVGLKCRVLGQSEMQKEKMGLLLGVARGSAEEPKFIILEHAGAGVSKTNGPVVLIGKGITFDSGGISLKPAMRMEDMKYDMMGAAAVMGIMQAVAELDLPVHVVAYIPAAENMPDGSAQKPGDVATSMTGKTVEITNTDAEGRLILADAIEYAQKGQKPQAMFDFATLTGAVIDALGTVSSGIMGNSQGLIETVKRSAEVTGERVWQLPLYEEYEEDLKSSVADIRNSGIREAGSSKGGTFLKFFVDPSVPWVHCDIAGTAYHRKDAVYHPQKFGSGAMIRLMTHLLENWKPIKKK